MSTYENQSEFARKYVVQWREEGFWEGFREGFREGLQEGEMAALLEVLDARGLQVGAAARQQIQACTDRTQLRRWLRKAVTVQPIQELFQREPAARRATGQASKRGRSTKARKPSPALSSHRM